MPLRRAAKLIGLYRKNVNAVRILWMHHHGEAKIRRDTARDVLPRISRVVGAVEPPVVLQKQTLRARFVQDNLVNALAKLGILFRHEHHANSSIPRLPGGSPVFGPVNACRGYAYIDPRAIARIRDNSVQKETTVARHPARPVGMIVQPADERPRFASVSRLKERCRLDAAIQRLRLVSPTQANLPNVPQRSAGFCGEPDA